MPLTNKGQKIMKSMLKKYGRKEGTSVFYASKNKGTIEGVEEEVKGTASPAMQALMKRTAELKAKKDRAALMAANKKSKNEETTSHPSSSQSRLRKELGDRVYKKLSSRPNDPTPVEAARARRAKKVNEAAPLIGAAARVIGSKLLRKGAVAAGRGAAQGTTRRAVATGARNLAKDPKAIGAMGTAAETGYEALKAQRASDKDLEETKMKNSYVNKLMEAHGARKMTPDEREGARRLAGHGRDKPGEEGKPVSPKKGTRASKKTQAAAARAEKEEADANNAAARRSTMKDHTEYQRIGALMAEAMGLIEAHQAYVDKKSKEDLKAGKADAGFAGPVARGTEGSRDPVVVAGKKRAGKTIERRVPGSDASKVSGANKAQVELNRRKKEAKKKKLGLPGGPLDKKTEKALSDRDKELRAGDQ